MNTLIMDNGANSIKIGWATELKKKGPVVPEDIKIIPNFIGKSKSERRRPFIASQIEDCRDSSGLYLILPFQKGYMCNPDTQKTIWDFVFSPQCQSVIPQETNILITEPILNFDSLKEASCELLFEEYGFNGVCRTTAPHMVDFYYGKKFKGPLPCTIVVDSGHSFTHVIPFVNGQKVPGHIKRIDVGGKVLTNHLKEIVSYRQLHVLDEFYLMNQVKEDLCYVSNDFNADMEMARKKFPENKLIREYILPNYVTSKRGILRPIEEIGTRITTDDQILRLNTERFAVPELIFHPSDVGMNEKGLCETILQVIGSFPENMQPYFYKNIVLSGGNVRFSGFKDRVYQDVRSGTSYYYDVKVALEGDPLTLAWRGGNAFANDPEFGKYIVTKKEYREAGLSAFDKKSDI